MRKLLLAILLIGCIQSIQAQQTLVKGIVSDTLEKKNLQNAVVSLIRKSDSTLFKFTRTDRTGSFQLSGIPAGQYLLMITYPRFADYVDAVEFKNIPENDLGSIPLTLKASLLEAVVIKSAGAIRIKGDTTEFIADSFKLKEGATVEDLLKRLPGFQVNSKGEITAQGQKVQKVLVDGEEFFGDDPTMATQNISSKAVDKVQVYDTKTDQQNLTGISTGTEGKTVNIKLKADAKKGAFGKANFGTDFQKYIDAKGLYNKFQGAKKLSLYATKSDVSTGSLNWEDKQKLGIENDFEYDEISGYYFSFGSSDEFSDWSLRGLPHSYTAGALYSNKWNEERQNVNLSYRYNRLGTINSASTQKQYILSEGKDYRNNFQNTNGLNQQHNITAKTEWKIDSLASFKFTTANNYKKTDLFSDSWSEYKNDKGEYKNRSHQVIDDHKEKMQSDNQLTYKQLFKKKDRLLIATLRLGIIDDKGNSMNQTHTDFYTDGVVDSVDIADQQKKIDGYSQSIGTKISWNEPLTRKWALVMEYAYNRNNSVSHRNTYDKDGSGKYEVLDQEYSNNFDLDVFSHTGNAYLKFTDKKLRAAFGSGVSTVKLDLFDRDRSIGNQYHFLNLTPQGTIRYSFKQQTGLYFSYRGTTRQPTIDQLQPIRDNSDRLNVFVGNPKLKVGFNNSFNMGFNTYKMLSQKGLFFNFSYNIPINDITFYNVLDLTRGKQTYTPVNVNGNRTWNTWIDLFKDGGEKKLGYGANIYGGGGRNNNFMNEVVNNISTTQKNLTRYLNSNLSLFLRYSVPDKKSIQIGPKVGYNLSRSSLQPQFDTKYWTYGSTIEGMILMPGKLELNTDCDFDLRQQLPNFASNPNQIIWNASLSKKVLKDKSGKISLIAEDILNQRRGFNRNITTNIITEERYSRISRYFLLKFEWTFNKMPGQTTK
ncbi:MAG: outer membrane beta-barrel protein [Flavisolibacter sp.]